MSNEYRFNLTLQPQPYEVVDGPQIAYGQITLGYCVGIRFEAHSGKWVDAIVFAPTPEDVERALGAFTITKTCYGSTNAPRAIMDATKLKPLSADGITVENAPGGSEYGMLQVARDVMEQEIAAAERRGKAEGFAKGKAFEHERIGKILGQYGDGQWWVGELESLVDLNGTLDQRRAVRGVLRSLLTKIGDLFSGPAFSEVAECSTVERQPCTKWADMDEDDPRWHLNAVVDGLLDGEGAYDDHLMWREALVKVGLAHDLINRITEKVCAQPSEPAEKN